MIAFKSLNALVCAGAMLVTGSAVAVPVTIAGTTVSFTFDSALAGLFGTPTVSGDSIFFTPTGFKVFSSNDGFEQVSQTFNIVVTANASFQIAGANLTESGDYYNINTSGLEGVAVSGQLRLVDLEAPLTPAVTSAIGTPAPLIATTTLPGGFTTSNWTAMASAAVPMSWGGQDGIPSAINVTIENILIASSLNASSAAFIEKKFAGLDIVTTPVPEPQIYALFLAGLGLIGFMARRRMHSVP